MNNCTARRVCAEGAFPHNVPCKMRGVSEEGRWCAAWQRGGLTSGTTSLSASSIAAGRDESLHSRGQTPTKSHRTPCSLHRLPSARHQPPASKAEARKLATSCTRSGPCCVDRWHTQHTVTRMKPPIVGMSSTLELNTRKSLNRNCQKPATHRLAHFFRHCRVIFERNSAHHGRALSFTSSWLCQYNSQHKNSGHPGQTIHSAGAARRGEGRDRHLIW